MSSPRTWRRARKVPPRVDRSQPQSFDQFVARVTSASGMPVAYRRTGTLDVAMDEATMGRFRSASEALAARGVAAELLDAKAARTREPHLNCDVLGGLLIPTQGFVAAADLTRALAAAAGRHGAQLIERGRAARISRSHGDLVVGTDRGSLVANGVVVAAGSWSGQIEIEGVTAALTGASRSRPASAARVEWAAAPACHLERAVLSGPLGGRDAPCRRDRRGGGVRRAHDSPACAT